MAELLYYSMMDAQDFITETAEFLGITDEDTVLDDCVAAALEQCSLQTGITESTPLFKQLVKFTAAQMYSDRVGELNNKSNSAVSGLMQNARFILRLRRDADESNNDA